MASTEKTLDTNQGNDPGKKPGIIALLLSVFCVPLLGVLVGIFALLKSRTVGQRNLFAILAIGINLVYTILLALFLVSASYVSKGKVEQQKQEEAIEALALQQHGPVNTDRIAQELLDKLKNFHAIHGVYPSYDQFLSEHGPLALSDEQREALVNTAAPRSTRVGFQACVASNGVSSGVMLRPGSGNTPLVAGDCRNIAARRE
ncbi:hypothetical protein [Methylobacillus sp.]|uniref:hypothetical protein n=1 Tax=Methylobacillus sp. TaxID=56818 RepID=UPI002FE1542E